MAISPTVITVPSLTRVTSPAYPLPLVATVWALKGSSTVDVPALTPRTPIPKAEPPLPPVVIRALGPRVIVTSSPVASYSEWASALDAPAVLAAKMPMPDGPVMAMLPPTVTVTAPPGADSP